MKFFFHVIYPFSLSVIFFLFPYFIPKLFCFKLLVGPYTFSTYLLVEFSFVILECPVLFILPIIIIIIIIIPWGPITSKQKLIMHNNNNCKCRLCKDRDKMVNHIISKCSKLAQKQYKIKHDWVGKEIHWELCKRLKFDHTLK